MFARSSVFLDCTLMIAYLNQQVESIENKDMVTTYHMGRHNVTNMTTIGSRDATPDRVMTTTGSRDPTPDRSASFLNYSGL